MKTLYVVYDLNDKPYEKYFTLRGAYEGARICAEKHGYPVYIDKFEWDDDIDIQWRCEMNDLWFVDEKGEGHGMDCLDDFGIKWFTIIRAETEHELNLFDDICNKCILTYVD